MDGTLTRVETRTLIILCQSGRLSEVRDWITTGRSIQIAPEVKTTTLALAIKTGFHSLVELIAHHSKSVAANSVSCDLESSGMFPSLVAVFLSRAVLLLYVIRPSPKR